MQKLLVPMLVLATVAWSSSNVLPSLSNNEMNTEPLHADYSQSDNTYSNYQQTRNKLNAFLFNVDDEPSIENVPQENDLHNNEDSSDINKDENYNVKGFRKEQWHNYPRQLDRLNRYFYEHYSKDKRNLDPDDPGNFNRDESVDSLEKRLDDITPYEFHQKPDLETNEINNEAEVAAAVINPLLILRIHLAYNNKDLDVDSPLQLEPTDVQNDKVQETNEEGNSFSNEMNPESKFKVKREDKMNMEDNETYKNSSKSRTVNKRIFSLWSRLQSLNPKGHQLHHRRHMYALYGPPDSEGGGPPPGVLTAETRATFMRPPGSPLRWG